MQRNMCTHPQYPIRAQTLAPCKQLRAAPHELNQPEDSPECIACWVLWAHWDRVHIHLRHHQVLAALMVIHRRVKAHTEEVLVVGRHHACT